MRLFLPIVILAALFSIACGSKAEYSDIKTDNNNGAYRTLPPADNAGQTPDQAASQTDQTAAPPIVQPVAPPASEPPQRKTPAFIDEKTGQIKDLPDYPESLRTNAQVGPMDGLATAMFVSEAKDAIEPIVKFYDQVAKREGWQVVTRVLESDNYKIELQKGELHEGLVQVRRDSQTGVTTIVISRVEKSPEPKQ